VIIVLLDLSITEMMNIAKAIIRIRIMVWLRTNSIPLLFSFFIGIACKIYYLILSKLKAVKVLYAY
tara:strand:+ start:228 stop:425 length:198 start_codon:yes stop_codon:yes gene_type:complete